MYESARNILAVSSVTVTPLSHTQTNESCHTHRPTSHVTHTDQRVMSHTHTNESCDTHRPTSDVSGVNVTPFNLNTGTYACEYMSGAAECLCTSLSPPLSLYVCVCVCVLVCVRVLVYGVGRLRLVGLIKLLVFFVKETMFFKRDP